MLLNVSDWSSRSIRLLVDGDGEGNLIPSDLDAESGVTRDLTIKGIDLRDGGGSLYRMKDSHVLKPGHCVVLETAEHVQTGNKVFGFICSRASLAAQGLMVSNLKIDPNYRDTLFVTAFNAGRHTITIQPGQPFCSIAFAEISQEVLGQATRPDLVGMRATMRERVAQYTPHFVTYVVSVVTMLIVSWFVKYVL